MATVSTQLKQSISDCVTNITAGEYKEMAYILDVGKNTFRNCKQQYGVLANEVFETDTVTKNLTYTQSFTVVLSKGFGESSLSDDKAVQASCDLREQMFLLYNHLIETKAGLPSRVLNITDLSIDAPEYLTDEKVTVLRGTFNVLYRLTLQ